ncbi:MAG: EamA family transporter [Candidatus Humimicrobiaceae bacterium]
MGNKFFPYLLAIITMFFWGIAPIFGKLGLQRMSPYTALAIRSFVISFILLIIVLVRGDIQQLAAVDARSAIFIAAEGIFASLLGHFAYYYALKLGNTSRVVPIASAFPIVTVIVALIFFSEKITLIKGTGIILILAGIFLLRF